MLSVSTEIEFVCNASRFLRMASSSNFNIYLRCMLYPRVGRILQISKTAFEIQGKTDDRYFKQSCKPKSCIQLGRPVYVGLLPQLSALCLIGCVGGLSMKWKGRSPDAALPFASLPRILAVLHEGDSPPRRVGRQPFPHFLYCLLPTTATSDLISYLFSPPPPQTFSKNPDTALLEKS